MTTKSKLLSWSLCCLLLLCTLAQIQAQSPGGAVTGTVRNAQSEPLAGSTVKLETVPIVFQELHRPMPTEISGLRKFRMLLATDSPSVMWDMPTK